MRDKVSALIAANTRESDLALIALLGQAVLFPSEDTGSVIVRAKKGRWANGLTYSMVEVEWFGGTWDFFPERWRDILIEASPNDPSLQNYPSGNTLSAYKNAKINQAVTMKMK
jgi:hypothetical protein